MAKLRVYLRSALVVIAVMATMATAATALPSPASPGGEGAGDSYYPIAGNTGYDVAGYNVGITYDPATRQLEGDTVVTATATQNLSRFNLDLEGLTVDSVTVNNTVATFVHAGHELVITPTATLSDGQKFRTRVIYRGTPQALPDGLGTGRNSGWQISPSGGAFVMGEPHSATSWYPANDTPRDKATFRLAATVPDEWTVVSIGRDTPPVKAKKPGYRTYRWAENTPTIPYLTNIAIDKFEIRRSTLPDGTPVVDAYAPGVEEVTKEAESRLPEVIAFLSSKYGPYPFTSAGGIFVARSGGPALETQGRPIYVNRASRLTLVVHENAHQWWGDSVSIDRWRDICLAECFASYSQQLWDEAEGKDLDQWYHDRVREEDAEFWASKLYDMGPGKEFTGVYRKGPLAVHALRRQIGDDNAFFAILRGWLAKHRYGNASWLDFEAYVSRQSGQDLRGFFNAWFHQTTKPSDTYL